MQFEAQGASQLKTTRDLEGFGGPSGPRKTSKDDAYSGMIHTVKTVLQLISLNLATQAI